MKVWPVKHSPLLRQPERFIARSELQALIRNVTQNLVNIKDESGQFLLRLDDGRVIDTKGWAGWEWTHGVGLYGIYQYYQQTGDIEMRDIIDRWFADRFAEGATTKNVNTMAPFLTLAYRFEETGRMAYLPWLESWAEWAMHEMPRTEQGGMQHMTLTMSASQLRRYRGGRCAMIFQEPLLAFDPVYTVGQQIIEGLRRHEGLSRQAARDRALEALRQVRIPSPERRLDAYPHEMSGGMRQRAMIALALSCNPQLLLADEPTTALDATVQIQILILLREQQKQRGLSIVFVTHDIGAAVEIADRVAVMYAGRIVEEASMSEILRHPRHPYTQVLLGSRPKEGLKKGDALHCIPGAPPDLARLPPGCAFAERCPHRRPVCEQSLPPTESVAERHAVSCHRWRELAIDANAQALAV